MDIMELGAIGELVGGVAVIASLVYVGLQVRQNTTTLRLQNDIELNRGFAAGELAFMGDSASIAFTTALFHPAKLTEAQLGQFWAYLHNVMLTAQNNWLAYGSGMSSERSWAHAKKQAATFVGFRAGRIWWDLDKFEYETDFVKEIDSELEGSDPEDFERVFHEMLESIRDLGR